MAPLAELPYIRVEPQRTDHDCGIVSLALLTGHSYEDVLEAAVGFLWNPHRRGMWLSDITKAADTLGVTLKRRRTWDWESAVGILCAPDHVAVLRWGLIFDDGEVWEADVWVKQYYEGKKLCLLARV